MYNTALHKTSIVTLHFTVDRSIICLYIGIMLMHTLRNYLEEHDILVKDFAKALRCHRMTVQKWLCGETRPSIRLAQKMQTITNGEITLKHTHPEFFV